MRLLCSYHLVAASLGMLVLKHGSFPLLSDLREDELRVRMVMVIGRLERGDIRRVYIAHGQVHIGHRAVTNATLGPIAELL